MSPKLFHRPAIAFLLLAVFRIAPADQPAAPLLRLPGIISDHLVLQSGQADALWGWTAAGTPVKAEFFDGQGKSLVEGHAITSPQGKWSLKLPSLPPGTSGQLRFTAGGAVQTVQDVLVGETWLCSGQSNMGYTFNAGPLPSDMPADMMEKARQQAVAAHGMIRSFTEWNVDQAETPQDDVKGTWMVVDPGNFHSVSCVAWYFAVALRQKLDRPVGLIIAARPGTLIEQWMSKAALESCPSGPQFEKDTLAEAARVTPEINAFKDADEAWLRANPTPDLQATNSKNRPVQKSWLPPMFNQLYNGLICPLEPYGIKGVIWFQADGNLGEPKVYGELIQALITNWRKDWDENLPFYYVEMNNMRDVVQTQPVQINDLSILREQQQAALQLPKVDVACSIDLGLKEFEPHFPNKEPVGQRLASLALNYDYGFPSVCHSPAYASFAVEGNKLRVKFTHADGLRVRGGGAIAGFAIRGATGDWVWAEGRVDGQDLILWSDQVSQPVAARYAWAMNPVISMENGAGLPMRPFRTDTNSPE